MRPPVRTAAGERMPWLRGDPSPGNAAMDIHHWGRFRDDKICLYRGTEDTALTRAMLSPR